MRTADAAQDDTQQIDQDSATGAQADHKTTGDRAGSRPKDKAHRAESDGDDPVAENDPLVLARKAPEKRAPAAKPKDDAEPESQGDEPAAEETEDSPADADKAEDEEDTEDPKAKTKEPAKDAEIDEATLAAVLSADAWSKLSHRDKSTFLGLKQAARIQAEQAQKLRKAEATQRKEADKHRANYETVDRFVREQGLPPDAYRNSVIIAGMVNRSDARAIPHLEESLKRLRQATGTAEPVAAPATPAVDADELTKELDAAEGNLDFTKVRQLIAKLKAPAAAPAKAVTQQTQVQQPPRAAAPDQVEAVANQSVNDYLVDRGVKPDQVFAHMKGLIEKNPGLRYAPPAERLKAVMAAHTAAQAADRARAPLKPRTPQPISGRGATAGGGRTTDPQSLDPLVRARQPKRS